MLAGDTHLRGDTDDNGIVDLTDIIFVASQLGTGNADADIDENGIVDVRDQNLVDALFLSSWGRRLLGDVDGNGIVEVDDLAELLANLGPGDSLYDLSGDGDADQVDVDLLTANLGATLGSRLMGDVDGNDIVNSDDLRCIRQQLGGPSSHADVDLDGTVSLRDYRLAQAVLGRTSGRRLEGDVNGDCIVDLTDLDIVLAEILTQWPIGDITGDGWTDGFDYARVLANLGNKCGSTRLPGDVNGDCVVDAVDQQMIVALFFTSNVQADLDGNGVVDNFDHAVWLMNVGRTCSDELAGDVNGDCSVDQMDLDIVTALFFTTNAQADLDHNGIVDNFDYAVVLMNWGGSCP